MRNGVLPMREGFGEELRHWRQRRWHVCTQQIPGAINDQGRKGPVLFNHLLKRIEHIRRR